MKTRHAAVFVGALTSGIIFAVVGCAKQKGPDPRDIRIAELEAELSVAYDKVNTLEDIQAQNYKTIQFLEDRNNKLNALWNRQQGKNAAATGLEK